MKPYLLLRDVAAGGYVELAASLDIDALISAARLLATEEDALAISGNGMAGWVKDGKLHVAIGRLP